MLKPVLLNVFSNYGLSQQIIIKMLQTPEKTKSLHEEMNEVRRKVGNEQESA